MSKEIFRDKLKQRLFELGIRTKQPEKIETIIDAADEVINPLELEKTSLLNIKKSLDMFDSTELMELRNEVTNKISDAVIKDEDILNAYDYLYKVTPYTAVTYRELYHHLHSRGIKKEFLDTKLVKMIKDRKLRQRDGCPVGWKHTSEDPVYPEIDGKIQYYMCYFVKD